ncbi:MAG: DUF2793 domain-containing protein [Pseudolabrys sp.]|nr:DUF2793 domain-containing protein [Pseudolabrys sp.]
MTDTVNLGLPCIEGSQAQKHVTHNDALRILDTLVQLAALDRDLTAPPATPADGERWIVKAGATGAWAGRDNAIAAWQDGAWQFCAPKIGWLAYVVDEGVLVSWDGGAWVNGVDALTPSALNNVSRLGVGTTADATNPLSAKLNNALFAARTLAEGGDGDLRYKLSKESAAKTLSFLFQDNYSGRAEIGLTGDDDFHFKVSPDGATWHDGIVIARSTGAVSFPNTAMIAGRETLTADRIYYVRGDGSDANTGLADTAGGAFLTVQKAVDVTASLDLSIYDVTIQIGNGTYTEPVQLRTVLGAGMVTLKGDPTTPSNVVINAASTSIAGDSIVATYTLDGLKIVSGNVGISLRGGGVVLFGKNLEFGANPTCAIAAADGASFRFNGNYTISGGGSRFLLISTSATVYTNGISVTLTGAPAFSLAYADVSTRGFINTVSTAYSGAATGPRYSVREGGQIRTNGAGVNFLPGNSAGTVDAATFGLYT